MIATEVILETETRNSEIENLLMAKLRVERSGCAHYLATLIGRGTQPKDLIRPLESLVDRGLLRHKESEPDDDRNYSDDQIVYEIR